MSQSPFTVRAHADNPSPVPPETLITAKELAELLAISERTVWRWDSEGRLPEPVRIGKTVRWRREETNRWIKAGCLSRNVWGGR